MSQFIFMQKYLQKSPSEIIPQTDPLITLTIELENNQFSQINIFEESNPDLLAQNFVIENKLDKAYIEPLKQNIIQQMLTYDKMKQKDKEKKTSIQQDTAKKRQLTNKENQLQRTPTKNNHIKRYTPEKITKDIKNDRNISRNKRFQTEDMNIHERLYQQSKQINEQKQIKKEQQQQQRDPNLTFKPKINNSTYNNRSKSPQLTQNHSFYQQKQVQLKSPRLNQLYQNKSFEFLIPKKEVKISILENEESVTQLPKAQESPNVSFSEESQFKNESNYTSGQNENSLYALLKESDEKIKLKLFELIETHNVVDPRNIPYEKFNYQMIVELRQHFIKHEFKIMSFQEFSKSVQTNHVLMKLAADFFSL